jgi:DNA (cytosine-5)-methyltransferase 1
MEEKMSTEFENNMSLFNVENIPDNKNYNFRYIDLFAGIGGIRTPFQNLGGKCVFSSEIDKYAAQTYEANYGEKPSGDITQISADSIPNFDVLLARFSMSSIFNCW